MTFANMTIGNQSLDAAINEYQSATLTAGQRVNDLLSVGVAPLGPVADTLDDLRLQAAIRLRYGTGEAAVIAVREFDPASDVFTAPDAAYARQAVRSAIRLIHGLGFAAHDEVVVGDLAVAAIRSASQNLSQLAYRLARADHVKYIHASNTLGRPVRVHRDFVVRCAVLGLGEALNAEEEPDLPTFVSVESWLSRARIRQQRR